MKKVCVIIPIYKQQLSLAEMKSVNRVRNVLKERDLFFICPLHMDTVYYEQNFKGMGCKRFPDKYFVSIQGYSRLLLNPQFYKSFEDYQYMLIAQTDSLILQDKDVLDEFMELGYDYIGAPWYPPMELVEWKVFNHIISPKNGSPRICEAGNGGFCLRNIKNTKKLLKKKFLMAAKWKIRANEDTFFAYYGNDPDSEYTIAPENISRKFALEAGMKKFIEKGEIPFAVHAWEKYWRDIRNCI